MKVKSKTVPTGRQELKVKSYKSKAKIATNNTWFYILLLPLAFCLFTLSGCASVKETAKGIAGVSTKALEDNRGSAITKVFNYNYSACRAKVLEILTDIKAYIYAQNKDLIAIYVSEEDTTAVGIFFKEIDANNTQVEVSSLSTYAKELISAKLFSGLEGRVIPGTEEIQK
jgi:hypothetical protein